MTTNPRRIVARYLSASVGKLDAGARHTANARLVQGGMDGNGRFETPSLALAKIGDILSGFGIEWGEVIQSFPLRKPSGRMDIDLAFTNPEDSFSPVDIRNSRLAFQWYRLENEKFEVVAYLS